MKRNFVIALILAPVCGACSSSTDASRQPQSITVTALGGGHFVAMNLGTYEKLTAVAKDPAGNVIAGAGPFSFTSRKTSIVTVDTAGVITGVGLGSTYVVVALPSGTRTLATKLRLPANDSQVRSGDTGTYDWGLADFAEHADFADSATKELVRAIRRIRTIRVSHLIEPSAHEREPCRRSYLRPGSGG